MSDEPIQNGAPPDEIEQEEPPKPKSQEEAKAARSMDSMQANSEPTKSAHVDDAKLANVPIPTLTYTPRSKMVDPNAL